MPGRDLAQTPRRSSPRALPETHRSPSCTRPSQDRSKSYWSVRASVCRLRLQFSAVQRRHWNSEWFSTSKCARPPSPARNRLIGSTIGMKMRFLGEVEMQKIIAAIAVAVALSGCATVTRGTTDQIQVITTPSEAQVTTSTGNQCPATPCTFEVSRKSEFVITAKKPGFQDASVPVSTRIAGTGAAGFAGNVLIGGIVGMGVDAATGATLEHFPNPVVITLLPLREPTPGKKVRRPVVIKPKMAAPVATPPVT